MTNLFGAGGRCVPILRFPILLVTAVALFLLSCNGSDSQTSPPPTGEDLQVMAEVEQYSDDGTPVADVTVVISRDGEPVAGAAVTLNGEPVSAATSGSWYRRTGVPFAGDRAVTIRVVSSQGDRVLEGRLPGSVSLILPAPRSSYADDASIPVAWEPIDWESAPTPHFITLEYTQGNPFRFVSLPPEATGNEIPAFVTSPSAMEFLIVAAWAGHADPGNLERGDWLGKDGLRLGTSEVTWVEILD